MTKNRIKLRFYEIKLLAGKMNELSNVLSAKKTIQSSPKAN